MLDVGCGGGILSEAMAHRGAHVTGIDMGEAPLAVAKLHLLESGLDVDYQQANAEDFALSHKAHYEVITCLEMLEHVPDPASVLNACYDMLKPGGHLFGRCHAQGHRQATANTKQKLKQKGCYHQSYLPPIAVNQLHDLRARGDV